MGQDLPDSWQDTLAPVLATPEARKLGGFLRAEEAAGKAIYPPQGCRLRALELTPLDQVKVVILGQDPYHGPGQAMGLAGNVLVEGKHGLVLTMLLSQVVGHHPVPGIALEAEREIAVPDILPHQFANARRRHVFIVEGTEQR